MHFNKDGLCFTLIRAMGNVSELLCVFLLTNELSIHLREESAMVTRRLVGNRERNARTIAAADDRRPNPYLHLILICHRLLILHNVCHLHLISIWRLHQICATPPTHPPRPMKCVPGRNIRGVYKLWNVSIAISVPGLSHQCIQRN